MSATALWVWLVGLFAVVVAFAVVLELVIVARYLIFEDKP